MNTTETKIENRLRRWFRLCPARHVCSLIGLLVIGAYFLLHRRHTLMQTVCDRFVRPWHRAVSRLCSHLPFSAAEVLIVAGVLLALFYIIYTLVLMLRRPEKLKRLYRFFMSCLTAFALIYGGFCLFWGVYYDCADFEDQSGVRAQPVSVEQLTAVTRYFTDLMNGYGEQIARTDDGAFAEDIDAAFDRSAHLYDAVENTFPCLRGDALEAKPFFFSRFMSYINFTGFFFPFTGEANINVDSPAALIPSTIAHEIAHQRGVAEEDEANFAAVVSSLENGDPVYCYSACLMAYIYLGNALHDADYDAWSENYDRIGTGPRRDLNDNNAYWKQFETPVGDVADSVYTGFLQSYGQTDGLKTYGKCVDLLIAYYYDDALEAMK